MGPGAVFIVPASTPHWFSKVSSRKMVYLIVRIDPERVLEPLDYVVQDQGLCGMGLAKLLII